MKNYIYTKSHANIEHECLFYHHLHKNNHNQRHLLYVCMKGSCVSIEKDSSFIFSYVSFHFILLLLFYFIIYDFSHMYTGKTTHDDSLYNDKKTHQQQSQVTTDRIHVCRAFCTDAAQNEGALPLFLFNIY